MQIDLKKFGTTLTSRSAGKEALAAFQPFLKDVSSNEIIEINFDGINTFSPSWADEFITPLMTMHPGKVHMLPTENPSVKITLELLKSIGKPE